MILSGRKLADVIRAIPEKNVGEGVIDWNRFNPPPLKLKYILALPKLKYV